MDKVPVQDNPELSSPNGTPQGGNGESKNISQPDQATESELQTSSFDNMGVRETRPSTEEELKAYVGSGWEYYANTWKPAITGEGKIGGFNIGGFFFSAFWLSCRKMYLFALSFYMINIVAIIGMADVGIITGKIIPNFLYTIPGLVLAILIGAYGNRWYFYRAKHAITQVHSQKLAKDSALQIIAKKGGKNFWAVPGLFLIFLVVLITAATSSSIAIRLFGYGSAEAYLSSGNNNYNQGDFSSAIIEYDQAIQRNPNYVDAYFNRGLAYYNKGDLDRAIGDWDKAIQLNPDNAKAFYNRGLAYYSKGDLDRAINDYDQAILIKPDKVDAYFNRGLAYADKGETQNAIIDFNKVLKICGTNTQLCQAAEDAIQHLRGK
jgi:tetratricopeptide (TPR) repeat protein